MRIFIVLLLLLTACQSGGTEIVCGGGGEFICPTNFYCHFGPECGGLDHEGRCRPLPHDCSTVSEPVCSCSGKEYENACYANMAGDNVAYRGPCMSK